MLGVCTQHYKCSSHWVSAEDWFQFRPFPHPGTLTDTKVQGPQIPHIK
jgi:hypothetical protein